MIFIGTTLQQSIGKHRFLEKLETERIQFREAIVIASKYEIDIFIWFFNDLGLQTLLWNQYNTSKMTEEEEERRS